MSNARYQPIESQGLLSEHRDRETDSSYREDQIQAEQPHNMPPVSQGAPSEDDTSTDPMQIVKPEGRKGDSLGLVFAVSGSLLLLVITWTTVLSNNPKELGLFAYHPPLQTLAIAFFALGILTLQPTSQPKTKAAGLTRHQLIILGLAIPCIAIGTTVIIVNKNLHKAPHFTSWHGTFGIISVLWMVVQIALGAGSVWFGGALFGGGLKAKAVWKYHRVSGYALFPLFLITAHLGGAWSTWMEMSTSRVTRICGFVIAPVLIWLGIWSRARLSKMKF